MAGPACNVRQGGVSKDGWKSKLTFELELNQIFFSTGSALPRLAPARRKVLRKVFKTPLPPACPRVTTLPGSTRLRTQLPSPCLRWRRGATTVAVVVAPDLRCAHKARTYLRHDVVAPRSALCLQAPSNGVGQPLLSQHVPSSSTFIDKNRPAPSNSSEPDLFGFVVGVVRLHVWAHSTRRSLNDLKADVRLAGKVQRQAVRFHAPRQQSNHVDRGKARQTKGRTLAHALLQVMGSKPS